MWEFKEKCLLGICCPRDKNHYLCQYQLAKETINKKLCKNWIQTNCNPYGIRILWDEKKKECEINVAQRKGSAGLKPTSTSVYRLTVVIKSVPAAWKKIAIAIVSEQSLIKLKKKYNKKKT